MTTSETSENEMLTQLIVIMGISGSGKSTLAQEVAQRLDYIYLDADDYHNDKAKVLMSNGQGITDEMRQEWVDRIRDDFTLRQALGQKIVFAFSGVKSAHRKQLASLPFKVMQFLLTGDRDVVLSRLLKRKSHFAGADLLSSQLNDFEPLTPKENDVIALPLDASIQRLTHLIVSQIKE